MESPLERVLRLSREPEALDLVALTWSDEARKAALKARMEHSFRTKLGGKVSGHLIHATQHGSDEQMAASEKHNVTAPIGHVLKTNSPALHGKFEAHAGIPGTTTSQRLGSFRTLGEAHEKVVAYHHGLATNAEAQHAALGIHQGDLADRAAQMHGTGSAQHVAAISRFGQGKIAPSAPKPAPAAPKPVMHTPAPPGVPAAGHVTSGGVTGPVGNIHPRPVIPSGHSGPTPGNASTPSAPRINYQRNKPKAPSVAQRQASLVGRKGRTHLSNMLEAVEEIWNG